MERHSEKNEKQVGNLMELKKHVAIIHSSNKLTLLQRKLANALLFHAYPDLQVKDEHTIHIGELCKLINYNSNDYKLIKRALVNLLSTVFEWNLVDGERLDSEGIWNASSLIADASIDGSICNYSYSKKMRNLLYRPNIYGRLDMNVQAKFQSSYGLALYENCNRFQDIGQTPWFEMEKFRKLMGVEEGKYKIFRDFKTRVLDKAIEEVNKYSHLVIAHQLRKKERRVTSIQFLIKKGNIIERETNPEIEKNSSLAINVILKDKYGLSTRQTTDIMSLYDEKYIHDKVILIESSASFKHGKIQNLAKYLLSALRDDYQPIKKLTLSSFTKKVIEKCNESDGNTQNEIEKQIKYERYQNSYIFKLFNETQEKDRIEILNQFQKFLTGIYIDIYYKYGFENILLRDQLCKYIKMIQHPILSKIPTYQMWLNENSK